MAQADPRVEQPASSDEAAEVLHGAARDGRRVRFRGGGTKLGWGRPTAEPDLVLSTQGIGQVLEHNVGDLTAVVQAGVTISQLRSTLAEEGQMLALDPPTTQGGVRGSATVGGVVASGDSGPLRHRFGAIRDLVIGITVAYPDGTVAKAGGKVIKNVAGYDLAKLLSGSFGTLGLIVDVSLRLHARPERLATARLYGTDPDELCAAASALAHRPSELVCLDLAWGADRGAVLARFAGATAAQQAGDALGVAEGTGLDPDVVEDDESLWAGQRSHQRSAAGTVVRVSALQTDLPRVLRAAARHQATVVGRAGQGLCWLTLGERDAADAAAAVSELRGELAPFSCVIEDAPEAVRERVDPWGAGDDAELALMRRVKARFDPARTCNPGLFVGGI
ncbi:MAG: FAD-binding oxidoreductase [Actinomycetota bacterium]|nr:FAD-binding oxidoreductase [Actinomycetota bacterium]